MENGETFLVPISPEAYLILAESARSANPSDVSTLASDILDRWARKISVERAAAYLNEHPEGWDDEPGDFFPGPATK